MDVSTMNGFNSYMIKNLELKSRFALAPLDMRMSLFDGTVRTCLESFQEYSQEG